MNPQDLLHPIDRGEPWPVRPGERWEARVDAVLPGLEIHVE